MLNLEILRIPLIRWPREDRASPKKILYTPPSPSGLELTLPA